MPSIEPYETKAGKRYRVRYRKPDHSSTDKRGFKTKREAELWLASLTVDKATGTYIDPKASVETVGALGKRWLDARKAVLKPSAYEPVEIGWRLRVKPKWGDYPVGKIRHSDVQDWISKMSATKSATVVLRDYGTLAAILDNAVLDRRIPSNPARNCTLPKKTKKAHTYLSHDQLQRLAAASGRMETFVLTLGYCGLRSGEARALHVRDFNPKAKTLHVVENAVEVNGKIVVGTPKSDKGRVVPVPGFLAEKLTVQIGERGDDELIFAKPDGTYLMRPKNSKTGIGWFARAIADAKVPYLTLHDLRHTAASLAVSAGANVKAVQRMLGHASAAMTLDTYADLFDDDLQAVATALDDAARKTDVGKTWAKAPEADTKNPATSA